jgi:hypothetical protein
MQTVEHGLFFNDQHPSDQFIWWQIAIYGLHLPIRNVRCREEALGTRSLENVVR